MKDQIIAGALFDFCGYITSQNIKFGAKHDVVPLIEALKEWAQKRNLSIDEPFVMDWNLRLNKIPSFCSCGSPEPIVREVLGDEIVFCRVCGRQINE